MVLFGSIVKFLLRNIYISSLVSFSISYIVFAYFYWMFFFLFPQFKQTICRVLWQVVSNVSAYWFCSCFLVRNSKFSSNHLLSWVTALSSSQSFSSFLSQGMHFEVSLLSRICDLGKQSNYLATKSSVTES
jgi:hypothetical protein